MAVQEGQLIDLRPDFGNPLAQNAAKLPRGLLWLRFDFMLFGPRLERFITVNDQFFRRPQPVGAGERFGMIRFGSRTEVFVPLDAEITVKRGDSVAGGVTVIARLPQK